MSVQKKYRSVSLPEATQTGGHVASRTGQIQDPRNLANAVYCHEINFTPSISGRC